MKRKVSEQPRSNQRSAYENYNRVNAVKIYAPGTTLVSKLPNRDTDDLVHLKSEKNIKLDVNLRKAWRAISKHLLKTTTDESINSHFKRLLHPTLICDYCMVVFVLKCGASAFYIFISHGTGIPQVILLLQWTSLFASWTSTWNFQKPLIQFRNVTLW